jgi:hypothetical protein
MADGQGSLCGGIGELAGRAQDLLGVGADPGRCRAAAHAYPRSSGAIAWYMSANKELGYDASDAGRSVA